MAASFYAEGALYLVSYFKAYHTNIQYSTKYNQQFLDVYNQLFYWIFLEHRTIVGNHALGWEVRGVEGRVQVIYNSVQLFLGCAPFPSLEVFSAPSTSFPSIKCTAFILESDSKQVIKHKHEKLCSSKYHQYRWHYSIVSLNQHADFKRRHVTVTETSICFTYGD